MELNDILKLGNEGAPAEWLAHLTGNGIEGIDGDILKTLIEEDNSNDPLFPVLPIEATPEIQFYPCSTANYTKGRGGNPILYLPIHFTSGANTQAGAALANCKYFNRVSAGASAHFFIDSGYTIWQSVPESDTAWHAGNWAMNQRSIGIEVCSAGAFTSGEIERLTWLVRKLMKKYNIPASRVIRHYDVTGKRCPAYYVDSSRWKTLHAQITSAETYGWKKDSKGWWYRNADGSYPAKKWQEINGDWYYFNEDGYMLTGWQKIKDVWYYLGTDGAMRTGWQKVNGNWFYLDKSGAIYENKWLEDEEEWYYLKSGGYMAKNEVLEINGKYYAFLSDGHMGRTDENGELA